MASESQQRRRCNIARIRAERNRLYHIRCASYTSADNKRNIVSYTLISESLVNACQRKLNRNTHVISYSCRGCTRAAPESVYCDNIRTAARYAACDSGNIMNRRNLYYNRFFILCRLFERINELAQILD